VNFGFFFLRPAALKMLAVAKATSALFALQATKIKAPNFHLLCPRGAYDGNGNLKSDSYKGISTITYNHLNLPKLITFSSGNTIEIVYDASGNKLRKIVKQGATVQYEQDYSGGIEYRKTPAAGTFRIEAIYHEEGRYFNLNVDASNTPSWRKEYALRDHLGNTRLLFADKDGDGMVEVTSNAATNEIIQENHYYPFGLSYGGSHWMNDAARDNGYKYNGKELNEDWGLGWYDYGARWYMPDLGRWGAVDPLAEEAPDWTPYRYGFNSPINYTDPDGLFESEEAARKYAKENNIEIRPTSFIGKLFTSGSRSTIEHNSDGSYSIDNRKESTSISDLGGDLGVMTSVLATPSDVMNVETEGNLVFGQTSTATLRDGSEVNITPLGGTAPTPGKINKNSLNAVGKYANYVIKVSGKIFKVGKADASRVTKSSGYPSRIHSQVRRLQKNEPNVEVSVSYLGETTTQEALRAERSILKKIYKKTGDIPPGNQKSFKPKN
jgi:RHS repeat-associated protein